MRSGNLLAVADTVNFRDVKASLASRRAKDEREQRDNSTASVERLNGAAHARCSAVLYMQDDRRSDPGCAGKDTSERNSYSDRAVQISRWAG